MKNSLLCPNQMRANGVIVDDLPVHLSPERKSTHSIYIPDSDVRLPLKLHGCLSYIPTRLPTTEEIESKTWVILTNEIEWDPYSPSFEEMEKHANYEGPVPSRNRDLYGIESGKECEISMVLSSVSSALNQDMLRRMPMRKIYATESSSRQNVVDKESLAKRWGIGIQVAAQTLQVTTQKGVRNAVHPIHKRFRTKQVQLKYDQLGTQHGRLYSDTMFSSVKSVQGNTMGQIFVNDIGFTRFIPMKSKSEAGYALVEFIQDIGIPASLHTDDAKELTLGTWRKTRLDHAIKQTLTEPYSPWQNRAEGAIRELKRHVHRLMNRSRMPKCLWDYCTCYAAEILCLTAQPLYSLHGQTSYELVTGNTPDISEYVEFTWFQPVWYYEANAFPEDKRLIGRWIGVAHRVGQAMCYWILPESGIPIARTTIQSFTADEIATEEVQKALKAYDDLIQSKIGDAVLENELPVPMQGMVPPEDEEDADGATFAPFAPSLAMPEADEFDIDSYDAYLQAEV
jgi:hypothetical protein